MCKQKADGDSWPGARVQGEARILIKAITRTCTFERANLTLRMRVSNSTLSFIYDGSDTVVYKWLFQIKLTDGSWLNVRVVQKLA